MKLLIDFILPIGIVANILLLYILWKNSKKEFHFSVLLVIFLWICLTQICFFGFIHKSKTIFFTTFLFQDTIPISIGPCLYLYAKAIFYPTKNSFKKNIVHFIIPFLYLLFASIPKLLSMYHSPTVFGHLRVGLENLWALSNINSLIYCVISIRLVKKANKVIDQYYANATTNDLSWLTKMLYSVILVFAIDVSITLYEVFYKDINSAVGLIAIFVVFLIIYLAYHGISQSKVLLPEFLLQKEGITDQEALVIVESDIITRKATHDSDEMQSLHQQLETLMQKEKWYLDPELSLKLLSEKLNISDKKLSYLLNQYMQVSFYDYVNRSRVEEVKTKIKTPYFSQYTLLSIALECGFNSKTSFNRTFHRFEGITPSNFRNQILKPND